MVHNIPGSSSSISDSSNSFSNIFVNSNITDTYSLTRHFDATPSAAVLDSGTSDYVSAVRSDFSSVSSKPDVIINTAESSTASKRIYGFSGKLRPNCFGFDSGVWFPHLPRDSQRLVPTRGLSRLGWYTGFGPEPADNKIHDNNGTSYSINDSFSVPVMEILFGDEYKSSNDEYSYGYCNSYRTTTDGSTSTKLSKLEQHKRLAHVSSGMAALSGSRCDCEGCRLASGVRPAAAPTRPESSIKPPLSTLACDFLGPFAVRPVGSVNYRYVVVCVEDSTGIVGAIPVASKELVADVLDTYISEFKRRYKFSPDDKCSGFDKIIGFGMACSF